MGCGTSFAGGTANGGSMCQAASRFMPSPHPGRLMWVWLQISCCQSTIRPVASSAAATRKLILTCPLDLHWTCISASKQCGIERDVVGAIVPVATRTVLMDHLDVGGS